jgi:hypothetical protein
MPIPPVTAPGDRFARAIAAFDAANACDPNSETAVGRPRPRELLYAERLAAMLMRFAPEAGEALRLAARCQHIERWQIPREAYPATREGYRQWRTRLFDHHALRAAAILSEAGYDGATIGRVCSMVRKESLKSDAEAQTLEDAVALAFMESYLDGFVRKHADYGAEKFADILRKTARKMSVRGREFALARISPPAALRSLIRQAIDAAATPPVAPRTPGGTPG